MNISSIPGAQQALERLAAEHGVTPAQVLSPLRYKSIAAARANFVHVLRTSTALSYPEIGRLIGRDHSTVMNAERVHEVRLVMAYEMTT